MNFYFSNLHISEEKIKILPLSIDHYTILQGVNHFSPLFALTQLPEEKLTEKD